MARALAASLAAGLAVRLLPRIPLAAGAALAAGAGWLALLYPGLTLAPHLPLARLPGLALLLAAAALAERRAPALAGAIRFALLPLAAAWWLEGAPTTHEITRLVPVLLGLIPALFLARRLAGTDQGPATAAAASCLAAALALCHAHPAWLAAALVPTAAALALFRRPEAQPPLAAATILVAALTVIAADRGRLTWLDAAAATPLLALWLFPAMRSPAPPTPARKVARRRPAAG